MVSVHTCSRELKYSGEPWKIRHPEQKPASKAVRLANESRAFDPFRRLQFKGGGAIGRTPGLVRSYHENHPLIDHSLVYNRAYLVSDHFRRSTCRSVRRKPRAFREADIVVIYLAITYSVFYRWQLSRFNLHTDAFGLRDTFALRAAQVISKCRFVPWFYLAADLQLTSLGGYLICDLIIAGFSVEMCDRD